MNLLANIFPVSTAINILKTQLEKVAEKKVDKFQLIYIVKKDQIYFKIDNEKYEFEDAEMLKQLIRVKIKGYIKSQSANIDYIMLDHSPEANKLLAYYQENNEKKFTEIKL